jgi:hypothetical protein
MVKLVMKYILIRFTKYGRMGRASNKTKAAKLASQSRKTFHDKGGHTTYQGIANDSPNKAVAFGKRPSSLSIDFLVLFNDKQLMCVGDEVIITINSPPEATILLDNKVTGNIIHLWKGDRSEGMECESIIKF